MSENGEFQQLGDQFSEEAGCGTELSPKVEMKGLESCLVSDQVLCGAR